MSETPDAMHARHEQEVERARVEEALRAERAETVRCCWEGISYHSDLGDTDQAAQLMLFFATGASALQDYRVVKLADAPESSRSQNFRLFEQEVGAPRKSLRVLHRDEPTPEGAVDGPTLEEIRDEALNRRARANARASLPRSAAAGSIDPNAGASEEGFGYGPARGNGPPLPETRPTPIPPEQAFELALEEIPELLEGFPADAINEAMKLIREYRDNSEALARFAAVRTFERGPDDEPYAWDRILQWSPGSPYPTPTNGGGPGARSVHLRRLLALARDRSDVRKACGDDIVDAHLRSPFRLGMEE